MKRTAVLLMAIGIVAACDSGSGGTEVRDLGTTTSTTSRTATTSPALPTPPSTSGEGEDGIGPAFVTTARPDEFALPEPVAASPSSEPALIHAVDLDSGEAAWTIEVPFPSFPFLQQIGENLVYSFSGGSDGSIIAAVGLDGEPVWQATTEASIHGPFYVADSVFVGVAGSPGSGPGYQSAVVAFSIETGELAWSRPLQWHAERAVRGGAGAIYAGGGEGRVVALDIDTGKRLWNRQFGQVLEAPLFHQGLVYVGTDRGLVALDAQTGRTTWWADTGGRLVGSPEGVAGGNAVSWLDSDAETGFGLISVDARDGERVWVGESYDQYHVVDDIVIGFGPDPRADFPNTIKVWDGGSGAMLVDATTADGINPFSVAADAASVYVGTLSIERAPAWLTAVSLETGRVHWSTQLRGSLGELATSEALVLAPASDRNAALRGALHAVDPRSGESVWTHETAMEVRTQPIVANGLVFVVTAEEILGRF